VDSEIEVRPCFADGALAALDRGDLGQHDRCAAAAAMALASCDVIVLAQFSLSRAAAQVYAATGRPVIAAPDSALKRLRVLLGETFEQPA
jgi:hypothetical protein